MDLDNIKSQWAQNSSPMRNIDPATRTEAMRRRQTSLDTLERHYRCLATAAPLLAVGTAICLTDLTGNAWMTTAFVFFIVLAGAMDLGLLRRVRRIRPSEMPVGEVAREAAECRHRHHLCQLILIPCALLLIGWLAASMIDEWDVLAGIACGAAVGLTIGLLQYRKMMKAYKKLTATE